MSEHQDALQPSGGWARPGEAQPGKVQSGEARPGEARIDGTPGPRPRLAPPPPSRRGLVFRTVARVSRVFGRKELPRIFPVFNINSRLFWPWLLFASRLMPFGRLPAPLREKLILRTAWNCRSRYEWGQHVEIALAAGVSEAEIVALARGPESVDDPVDAAALRACDELCHCKLISDTTWHTLAAHFSEKLLIEIIILVGHYEMVAALLINSGIELEPTIETVLTEFNLRAAAIRAG